MTRASRALLAGPWLFVAVLSGGRAGAAEHAYSVVAGESRCAVHVGRAGLFKFAGHEHEVLAGSLTGRILADPEALERSSVRLSFEAGALRVSGQGEPAEDVPKVQEAMLGPRVLDVARFPTVVFESRGVAGKALGGAAYELQLQGELSLHGQTRTVALPLRVELTAGRLVATGRTKLRQSDYGIRPISVAGVVKVKDELTIDFAIVARQE